jgi:hypothetical protein
MSALIPKLPNFNNTRNLFEKVSKEVPDTTIDEIKKCLISTNTLLTDQQAFTKSFENLINKLVDLVTLQKNPKDMEQFTQAKDELLVKIRSFGTQFDFNTKQFAYFKDECLKSKKDLSLLKAKADEQYLAIVDMVKIFEASKLNNNSVNKSNQEENCLNSGVEHIEKPKVLNKIGLTYSSSSELIRTGLNGINRTVRVGKTNGSHDPTKITQIFGTGLQPLQNLGYSKLNKSEMNLFINDNNIEFVDTSVLPDST